MKKLMVLTLLCCVSSAAYAETLNLNTYYPAPFGAYDRLQLVPRDTAPSCTATLKGALYFDNTLNKIRVCQSDLSWGSVGVWAQNGNNIYPADTATNPNLRVGIGTTAPANTLSVGGSASVGSGYAGTAAPADGLIVQGRVAIGTATPSDRPLTVRGTPPVGRASLIRVISDGGTGAGIKLESLAPGGRAYTISSTSDASILGGGGGNLLVEDTTTLPAIPRMIIRNNGNVGIGTVSPTEKLDVVGTIKGTAVLNPTYAP